MMRTWLLMIAATVGSFLIPYCAGQCPANTADAKNASTITVALSVNQGWIWADKVIEFCPTATYKSRRRDFSRDPETLLEEIRTAMKGLPKFYVFALTTPQTPLPTPPPPPSGIEMDRGGKLTDPLTSDLRTKSYPPEQWKAFQSDVKTWTATVQKLYPSAGKIVSTGPAGAATFGMTIKAVLVGRSGTSVGLSKALKDSPLYFADATNSSFVNGVAQKGTVTFNIVDPIGDWNSADYHIDLPPSSGTGAPVITTTEVIKQLQDLEGQLWSKPAIDDRIADLFLRTGFNHTSEISEPTKHPVTITIGGAAQLMLVQLMMSMKDIEQLNRALYMVLPDSQFRYVLNHESGAVTPLKEITSPVNYVNLCVNSISHEVTYLRNDQLAALPGQLDAAGFKLEVGTYAGGAACNLPDGEQLNYVEFRITPQTNIDTSNSGQQGEKPKTAPQSTPNPRVPPGQRAPAKVYSSSIPAGPQVLSGPNPTIPTTALSSDPDTSPESGPVSSGAPAASKIPEKGSNYIGFGLAYRPNQGVRFVGQYQRELPNQQVVSLSVGTESAALGSGSYHKDFLLFDTIHRRLQFDASGGTNYTHNRLFQGIQTNERRTGGSASLTMEWIRSDNGFHLDSALTAGSSDVTLTNLVGGQSQQLTYVDVNTNIAYFSSRAQQTQIHLQPTIRFGTTSAATGGGFVSGSISADLLQFVTPSWMPDIRLEITPRFQGATGGTPEFELPSIGGAETVRGFRADASLARLATTIQNELWIPSTGPKRFHGGVKGFLSHNVWVAPFLDYGYSSQAESGIRGSLWGPGIGARVLYGAALFKLDWGYGLYSGPAGLGGSKFSFDVKTTLPF